MCGASKVVSAYDGSLDKWVNEHICKNAVNPQPKTATLRESD
jgi:hypothetical protein